MSSIIFDINDQATATIRQVEKNVIRSTKNMSAEEGKYAREIAKTQTKMFELKQESATASKERIKDIKQEISYLQNLQRANKEAYNQAKRSKGGSSEGGLRGAISEGISASPLGGLASMASNPAALAGAAIVATGVAIYNITEKVMSSQDAWRQRVKTTEAGYEELGKATLKVSEVFGKNNDEIVKAGNSFAKAFGIDAKEGLDIMYEGFKKGADMNGQFLDNLNEYSIQAKEAGMSTQEFVGFLIAAEKEGIYSDKGIDSIKEAGLRLRRNEKASMDAIKPLKEQVQEQIKIAAASGDSFEAMKLITNELDKGYLSAQQVQAIMSDVMGGAGEDSGGGIVKVLSNANLELSSMQANLSENQLATIALKEEWANFESSVGTVFDDGIISIKRGIVGLLKFLEGNNPSVEVGDVSGKSTAQLEKDRLALQKIIVERGEKFGLIDLDRADNLAKMAEIEKQLKANKSVSDKSLVQLNSQKKSLTENKDRLIANGKNEEAKYIESQIKAIDKEINKRNPVKTVNTITGPKEGDISSDGKKVYKNGKWVSVSIPNPTPKEDPMLKELQALADKHAKERAATKQLSEKSTTLAENRVVKSLTINIDKALQIEKYSGNKTPEEFAKDFNLAVGKVLGNTNSFLNNQ